MSARNTSKITNKGPKPFCKVCQDAGKSESEYTNHFVRSEPGPNGKVVCPTLLAQECRYCFQQGHTAGYCPVIATNKAAEEKALKQAAKRVYMEEQEAEKAKPKSKAAKKITNSFAAAFCSDSDSEEEKHIVSKKAEIKAKPAQNNSIIASLQKASAKVHPAPASASAKVHPAPHHTKEEEFPALPTMPKFKRASSVMTGYATMAAKTPVEFENEKYHQQLIENSIKRQLPPIFKATDRTDECILVSGYDSWDEPEPVRKPFVSPSLLDWAAIESDSDDEW
jgi:hypothetical protein